MRSELCRHLEEVLQVWCVLHVDAEGKGRGSCSRICLYWECLVTVFVTDLSFGRELFVLVAQMAVVCPGQTKRQRNQLLSCSVVS